MNLGIIATRELIDLHVGEAFPPIPIRNYDYSAIDANTYDVDYEGGEYEVFRGGLIGYGPTPVDAINDLLDQLEAQ